MSFVNAPDVPDPHITFTTNRDQVQPAEVDGPLSLGPVSLGPVSLGSTIPVGAP